MVRWFRATGWRHVVGLAMLAWVALPLLYVLSASLSSGGTLTGSTELFASVSLDNYASLLAGDQVPYVTWWLNTMKIAALTAGGVVTVSTLAAYAFSRMRFRFRRQGLTFVVLLQMFPAVLSLVAVYLMLNWLGNVFPAIGIDTQAGLLLMYLGASLGIYTYLLTGNFNTIPRELDEAARIDGAGHLRIFVQITLPLAVPMLAVVGLLMFLATVGEYAVASVVLSSDEVKTAAVGLTSLISGPDGRNANWGLFSAGAILLAVPVLVLFFLLQRYIVGGLTSGSVK